MLNRIVLWHPFKWVCWWNIYQLLGFWTKPLICSHSNVLMPFFACLFYLLLHDTKVHWHFTILSKGYFLRVHCPRQLSDTINVCFSCACSVTACIWVHWRGSPFVNLYRYTYKQTYENNWDMDECVSCVFTISIFLRCSFFVPSSFTEHLPLERKG